MLILLFQMLEIAFVGVYSVMAILQVVLLNLAGGKAVVHYNKSGFYVSVAYLICVLHLILNFTMI